jgi:hypothetical protein
LLPAALAYDTAPTDAAVMMTPSVNALSLLNCISISLEIVDLVSDFRPVGDFGFRRRIHQSIQ